MVVGPEPLAAADEIGQADEQQVIVRGVAQRLDRVARAEPERESEEGDDPQVCRGTGRQAVQTR